MTTIETRKSNHSKRSTATKPAKLLKTKPVGKPRSAPPPNRPSASGDNHPTSRVTKHDRVLELLNRADGTTISEMMQATGWLQHSVRGFLAGTVKKKRGFALTSSKVDGEPRRYKIATSRRGR